MSIWTRFLGGSSKVEHRTLVPVVDGSNPSLPTVSRRSFFIGTAATAIAVPSIARTFFGPPRGGWPVGDFTPAVMRYRVTERYAAGYMDPGALYGSGFGCKPYGPMTAARFREIVEPEVSRVFRETYANRCQEWEDLYGDGIALNSTAHPENPELFGFGEPEPVVSLDPASLETLTMEKYLCPDGRWHLKIVNEDSLKHFERKAPILIKPGRRWFK